MSAPDNRREGFRLDDKMNMHVKPAGEEHLEEIIADFESYRMRYCLKSHLRNQADLWLPKLLTIRQRDPEVAEYLEHLEVQMAQLAARLPNDEDIESDAESSETSVNMSSTGIRFQSSEKFSVGQQLELGMVLSTTGTQIVAIAEIIRVESCDKSTEGDESEQFLISTQYVHIHSEDTEAIIRHMAKLQQIQLQIARQNSL